MTLSLPTLLVQAVKAVPRVFVHLSDAARSLYMKQFVSYEALRSDYWSRIFDAVDTYLNSDRPITLYRNSTRNLASDYFQEAAELGYQDGGAELPLDDATQALIDERIAAEIGHVNDLFTGLRDNAIPDYTAEAFARADGYSASLDAAYNLGKMAAAGNQMLTWNLGATEQHCATCAQLDGQRHRASWFIDHNYIPRQPGSETLECGGWNCDCSLTNDDGDEVTL